MLIDIPECKRCIFCFPLRHGIIIFGYLNLIFAALVLALEIWLCKDSELTSSTFAMYRGVVMYTHAWFPMALYIIEIVFNIALLIGAHTKTKLLIQTYYYYGISTTLATFLTLLVVTFESRSPRSGFDVLDLSIAFCGFVIQIYLLLLIRSELLKLRYQDGTMTFVNHLAEVTVPRPPWGEPRNPL